MYCIAGITVCNGLLKIGCNLEGLPGTPRVYYPEGLPGISRVYLISRGFTILKIYLVSRGFTWYLKGLPGIPRVYYPEGLPGIPRVFYPQSLLSRGFIPRVHYPEGFTIPRVYYPEALLSQGFTIPRPYYPEGYYPEGLLSRIPRSYYPWSLPRIPRVVPREKTVECLLQGWIPNPLHQLGQPNKLSQLLEQKTTKLNNSNHKVLKTLTTPTEIINNKINYSKLKQQKKQLQKNIV